MRLKDRLKPKQAPDSTLTTAGVRDMLGAVGLSRPVVVEMPADSVLLRGEPKEVSDLITEWWSKLARRAAADPVALRWSPSVPLRVEAGSDAAVADVLGGDELARSAALAARDAQAVFAALAHAFAQVGRPVLLVVESAELHLADSIDPLTRQQLAPAVAMLDAFGRHGRAGHHGLVFVTSSAGRLPASVLGRPGVMVARLTGPDEAERLALCDAFFHDVDGAVRRSYASRTDGLARREFELLRAHADRFGLDPTDAAAVIRSYRTGTRSDPWLAARGRRSEMRALIRRTVLGQPDAIEPALVELDKALLGLSSDPTSVIGGVRGGPMLFLGPTGTGKTELAKAFAQAVFGTSDAIIRISMEAYSQPHAAERLFGAPPGFVGHSEGSELVNALLRNPHQVILLDEIEKAHPQVLMTLLGVLDDGVITDGRGQTATLSDAVVIATSNLGAAAVAELLATGQIEDSAAGIDAAFRGYAQELIGKTHVRLPSGEVVEGMGRPELWFRLARPAIVFDRLRMPVVQALVDKQVDRVRARLLAAEGIELDVRVDELSALIEPRVQEQGGLNGRLLGGAVDDVLTGPLAGALLAAPRLPSRVVAAVAGDQVRFELLP